MCRFLILNIWNMGKIKINFGGKIVEIEKEAVTSMVEEGEIKVDTEGFVIKTTEEQTTYESNFGRTKYEEGKTAGYEMDIKKGKEEFGLEFEGKNILNFGEALKTKVLADAKVEPNKRILELEGDLEKVRANYTTLETGFNTFKSETTEKETRSKKDTYLLGVIPDQGLKVSKNITLTALKAEGGVDITYTEEGKAAVTVFGEVQKNPTDLTPVDPKVFIGEKIKALGLVTEKGNGRGAGDEDGDDKVGGYDAFEKEMKAKGVDSGSMEFNEEMNKRIADKTLTI